MPSKEQIKSWLKEIGKDREWLAIQCGAKSKRTVEKWFETKGTVPAKAILKINELMRQTGHQPSKQLSTLPDLDNRGKTELRLDYDTQRKVEKEALRLCMEFSTYCTLAVEWCCEQEDIGERLAARLAAQFADLQEETYVRVAEEEVEYGNQSTEKQERTNRGLPSHAESTDPASQKRTTGKTLGVLRLGTDPDAKRKSGSA